MVEIMRYEASMAKRWDEFASQSRNATFLHQRGYMDYHSDRFADCSLVALHNGRVCALLPANVEGDTLWSHRGLTYGGWLLPYKHFDTTVMVEVMDATCQWMAANGLKRLVYKPVPHIYHRYPCEEDLYALFRHQAALVETNISTTIDLTCPLPLDRGYDTRPVHTLDEMCLLHDRFPGNICRHTATLDGELLAGVVMYLSAPVAHCQYIGASTRGKDSKALTLLFEHLIDHYKRLGFRYFDFGISNEDHGRYLNAGLVKQKSRLGGRGIAYNTLAINL